MSDINKFKFFTLLGCLVSAIAVIIYAIYVTSAYRHDYDVDLQVISCRPSANITISKCSDYEYGCVNPQTVFTVVSDIPGAKAQIKIRPGFYHITDGYEERIVHYDPYTDPLEKFGCDEEKISYELKDCPFNCEEDYWPEECNLCSGKTG